MNKEVLTNVNNNINKKKQGYEVMLISSYNYYIKIKMHYSHDRMAIYNLFNFAYIHQSV